MQQAYSEYLLYDPIVRIAKDNNWKIKCEYAVDKKKTLGEKKRIDFLFTSTVDVNLKIGVEVKFFKKVKSIISITKDVEKLKELDNHVTSNNLLKFIIIAGNHSKFNSKRINNLITENNLVEYYKCDFRNQFNKHYGVTVVKIK